MTRAPILAVQTSPRSARARFWLVEIVGSAAVAGLFWLAGRLLRPEEVST